MARAFDIDPIDIRLKNAAREGTKAYYGPTLGPIGYVATLEKAKQHPQLRIPLGPNQGRGIATGFWFKHRQRDHLDAERERGRHGRADDGHHRCRGRQPGGDGDDGGRGARHRRRQGPGEHRRHFGARLQLRHRRQPRDLRLGHGGGDRRPPGDRTRWRARAPPGSGRCRSTASCGEDGHARPASSNVGEFEPMSIGDIARVAGKTGGPIAGHAEINAQRRRARLSAPISSTSRSTPGPGWSRSCATPSSRTPARPSTRPMSRASSRAARSRHRLGAQRGVHLRCGRPSGEPGLSRLPRAGRLGRALHRHRDRRGAQPQPPLRVWRGIGEVPIIPPMAAISNAIHDAIGIRLREQPDVAAQGPQGDPRQRRGVNRLRSHPNRDRSEKRRSGRPRRRRKGHRCRCPRCSTRLRGGKKSVHHQTRARRRPPRSRRQAGRAGIESAVEELRALRPGLKLRGAGLEEAARRRAAMNAFVLDCSITAAWPFDDEAVPETDALGSRHCRIRKRGVRDRRAPGSLRQGRARLRARSAPKPPAGPDPGRGGWRQWSPVSGKKRFWL